MSKRNTRHVESKRDRAFAKPRVDLLLKVQKHLSKLDRECHRLVQDVKNRIQKFKMDADACPHVIECSFVAFWDLIAETRILRSIEFLLRRKDSQIPPGPFGIDVEKLLSAMQRHDEQRQEYLHEARMKAKTNHQGK